MIAPGEAAAILARSNELDMWQRRLVNNWQAGYAAAETAHADDWDEGYAAGVMGLKRAQHDAVELTALETARWGSGGRQHFSDPRPGDYPGRPLPLERPGQIWLAGSAVHSHQCAAACRKYEPGFYTPEQAATILAQLPGNYSTAITGLRPCSGPRLTDATAGSAAA
jgi:hypothetical protein